MPHQFQKGSALNRIVPFFSGVGKLALDELFEDGRVGEFFKAAPVLRALGPGNLVAGSAQIQFALLGGANVFAPRIISFFHLHSPSDYAKANKSDSVGGVEPYHHSLGFSL